SILVQGRGFSDDQAVWFSGAGLQVGSTRLTPEGLQIPFTVDANAAEGYRSLRVLGPGGWSNALRIRVDHLVGLPEREPNEGNGDATPLTPESAVEAELGEADVDEFPVRGDPGATLTVEVESRRLGVSISPALSLTDAQGRPIRPKAARLGLDGDPRIMMTVPGDGHFRIQVRDLLYRGGAGVAYRLRVTTDRYPTGLFPLGGPAGSSLRVQALGGNLGDPQEFTARLPTEPGWTIAVEEFSGPTGRSLTSHRLVAGDLPELREGRAVSTEVRSEPFIWNGRIDVPGEIDRLRVRVVAGVPLSLQVEAAVLGSWLDSVLEVRDERGVLLAENDDAPSLLASPDRIGQPTPDSRIDWTPERDGVVTLELTDRASRGGPEFAYRLRVGPRRDDFAIVLLPSPTTMGISDRSSWQGAFNLPRGTTTRIPFRVIAEGKLGPVTVLAEGLPDGVVCPPVVLSPPPSNLGARSTFREAMGVLRLEASASAPGSAAADRLRFVGEARSGGNTWLRRHAEASVPFPDRSLAEPIRAVQSRQASFPVAVVPLNAIAIDSTKEVSTP
ncbi:MAG: hypothetical protein AB7I30_18810, partial [Isosphaeraceae bacterium]